MKNSARRAKRAAKAKLSGAPRNKKVVFGDDDDISIEDEMLQMENNSVGGDGDNIDDNLNEDVGSGDESGDSDDGVEEVTGSSARESTQRLREAERKVAKESMSKKKRRKVNGFQQSVRKSVNDNVESSESESEEEGGDLLTDDFFKMVDSERAGQLQKTKQERKHKKMQQKKMLGKHTTFIAEGEYEEMSGVPHKIGQNIEVVAIGGGETTESTNSVDDEQQLLMSAMLGSAPSKTAILFARGSMNRGTSKERSSDSRKRKTKNEETWKRSRKLNKLGVGSRPGQAAAVFVCKK